MALFVEYKLNDEDKKNVEFIASLFRMENLNEVNDEASKFIVGHFLLGFPLRDEGKWIDVIVKHV